MFIRLGKILPPEDYNPEVRFGKSLNENFTWMDYYASADPVPNGPLYDRDQTPDYLKANSIEVHNRSAILSDHTTYWDNRDEFVGAVALAVSRLAHLKIITEPKQAIRLQFARYRRRWRVRCLLAVRMFAILAMVGLPYALFSQLELIGQTVMSLGVQGQQTIPLLTTVLPVQLAELPKNQQREATLGFATIEMLVLAGYWILYMIWRLWETMDLKAFFDRVDYSFNSPMFLFLYGAALFLEIGLAVFVVALDWVPVVWNKQRLEISILWASITCWPAYLLSWIQLRWREFQPQTSNELERLGDNTSSCCKPPPPCHSHLFLPLCYRHPNAFFVGLGKCLAHRYQRKKQSRGSLLDHPCQRGRAVCRHSTLEALDRRQRGGR